MHSVPVTISTVTQAHTVAEGVTMQQTSQVSRCRCILCMQVTICKREKCICLECQGDVQMDRAEGTLKERLE